MGTIKWFHVPCLKIFHGSEQQNYMLSVTACFIVQILLSPIVTNISLGSGGLLAFLFLCHIVLRAR